MRLPPAHADRRRTDVTMTPMIDVVFLLLIFFVCTASFQMAEETLPTSLLAIGNAAPTEEPLDEPLPDEIIVKLRLSAGRPTWLVNDRSFDTLPHVEQVLRSVFEIDAAVPVILDTGGEVPLGRMIDLYDLCRRIGFEEIQFAATITP